MTELDFKLRNPNIYGGGSMNLLYSSSRDSGSLPLPVSQIPPNIIADYAGTGVPVPDPNIPSSSINGGIYDNVVSYPGSEFEKREHEYLYTLKDGFFPPYSVVGLTISFSSLNNVRLEDTLRQIKFITFKVGTDRIRVKVLNISKLTDYYYLQVEPTVFDSMSGNTDSSGTPIDFSVEVSFTDYLSGNFTNSEFDVLLGNALRLKTSKGSVQVDRNTDAASPSNLNAIITDTAALAEVQYSNYTTVGWTNARYEGSVNTPIQERDLPAQSYIMFEGAIHPLDGDKDTLLALGAGDPEKTKLYFNVESRPTDYIPSGSALLTGSTFPLVKGSPLAELLNSQNKRSSAFGSATLVDLDTSINYTNNTAVYGGSIIFKEDGNKLVRVVSSKIHAVEKGSIYTTDEFGIAINEEFASTGSS
jgi:hypothetical protein